MSNLSSSFGLFLNPSWIQIRTQFLWVPVYYHYWAHVILFSPFSLSLLQCFSASLSCSRPLQSPYTAPFLSQSPIFSLFITLSQTPTLLLITSPSHLHFQLISATTHSIIRMGSPKVVDLERELAYLWFAVVWGLRRYVGCADLWVWRYRGLRQYGVVAVWGLCRYLRGGGGWSLLVGTG
jgi:hypothetical protein